MIAPVFVLAILLVGRVSGDVNASPVEVSQVQPVPVHHIVSNQPEPHHQVVGVEHPQQHQQQAGAHHHQVVHQHPQQPQYYSAPSGLIQPIGNEQQQHQHQQYAAVGAVQQPQQPILKQYSATGPAVASISGPAPTGAEQYGQPESASIPPNYKPFGSWGLYIGGNPADGYYSSYYKALGQSVSDKQQHQQHQQQVAPVSGDSVKPIVSQAEGLASGGPLLKQAFVYQDQGYPYESSSSYYTPADLNSGSRVAVAPQAGQYGPAVYNYVEQPSVSGLSYASSSSFAAPEQYANTKRSSSSSYATKSRDVQVPQAPIKGYQQQQQQQQGYFSYAAGLPAFAYQSPVEHQQQQQHHQQVVAYPVPVGSQIVGSQPGVEGSFAPFGVHGFTRYAIKPTVVAAAAPAAAVAGVHSAQVGQFPVYKQVIGYQQPLSFYGYPLSQLHYSQGSSSLFGHQGAQVESGSPQSVVSSSVQQHPHTGVVGVDQSAAPVAHIPFGYPVEAASSEKSESTVENKPAAGAATASAPVQPVNSKPTSTQ